MGMILFLLKEHRDSFPDFAPWLFETDYKAGCATIALFIVHIGIAQLHFYIWWPDWTEYIVRSLIFSAQSGFVALIWLWLPAWGFVKVHNPFSILFVEEILILLFRWLVIYLTATVESLAPSVALGLNTLMLIFIYLVFVLTGRLDHRFKDTLSRAAGTFGLENIRGSLYEPIVFFDAES